MKKIESIMSERRLFAPPSQFGAANIASRDAYDALAREAEHDWENFWASRARAEIAWHTAFNTAYTEGENMRHRWFADGTLNVTVSCLDRHVSTHGERSAIIYERDNGEHEIWSYGRLYGEVCRLASALHTLGVGIGDRVVIYMPMVPHAVVAMLACARIGAIHSVVFGGFSAKALHQRIVDCGAVVVITADASVRGGKQIPLLKIANEAIAAGCETVRKMIVFPRVGSEEYMVSSRAVWWHDVTHNEPEEYEPVYLPADSSLFILYTSGSTGRPKGIHHAAGGYLLGAILSMRSVFDYRQDDIYWCTADVGWITGHTYIAYGPLAVGATQVMFEGVPTYPDAGRFWDIVDKHKVTTLYTAPTAIRSLIKSGPDIPRAYDLSSLRLLGTVGEPINPEAWMWYYETIGRKRCPIVDTWWQTETGSNMISPLPGAIPTKPGSCAVPLPGINAAVVDAAGNELPAGEGGYLVIRSPWPSQLVGIWNDPERYMRTYYPSDIADGRYYVAGDSAYRDEDGYFWILGRIDDVLNVSGHRLGTMEIESALVAHALVAEAAVVGRPDALTGEAIVAFVVLREARPEQERAVEIAQALRQWVRQEIGAIARPQDIRFGDNLPKTRSGKIMRRLLRAIAAGEDITQDVSTLENPAILDQLSVAISV